MIYNMSYRGLLDPLQLAQELADRPGRKILVSLPFPRHLATIQHEQTASCPSMLLLKVLSILVLPVNRTAGRSAGLDIK